MCATEVLYHPVTEAPATTQPVMQPKTVEVVFLARPVEVAMRNEEKCRLRKPVLLALRPPA